jgi:hypothetical protein
MMQFDRPLSIFVGLGFPRQVQSVVEAYQLLQDWSEARGPAHAAALKACRAAMAGEIDAETARGVVEGFARHRGILVSDVVAAGAMPPAASRLQA